MAYRYEPVTYYQPTLFPKGIKWLLIVTVAAFVLTPLSPWLLPFLPGWETYLPDTPSFSLPRVKPFVINFGLVPKLAVGKLMLWQFVTYMFLHGGFFHILFNMFALWVFGRDIETLWGTRRFLKYYFITGIGAGVLTWLTCPTSVVPLIGASGAIFGILLAFGMLFPDRPVFIYFIFPVPARLLVIIFAAIELLASFSHTPDGIGHFAHLGGMLVGYLYIKGKPDLGRYTKKLRFWRRKRSFKVVEWKPDRTHQRIDRILDKISSEGIDSLTPEEKKALEDFSKGN